MKDLLYNIDSIEIAYGDNALNTIIQIQERINLVEKYLQAHHDDLNDFEKSQLDERLNKLADLNIKIQDELQAQIGRINTIAESTKPGVKINPLY